MTKQELEREFDDLFKTLNGMSLDYDGVYGAQCFDLIQAWNRDWLNSPYWITGEFAYQIYGQLPNIYTSIPNTPEAVPQKGDIVVWAKAYNGFAGHTGVATGKGDTNTFECFEQNDPTGSVCHLKIYNYNHVVGWLRFKTQSPDQLAKCVIDRDINWNIAVALFSELGVPLDSNNKELSKQNAVKAIQTLKAAQGKINQVKGIVNG